MPQNFGGWSGDDTCSDGLIYKGCLSCHSINGAYTYASHNSREAEIGRWGALAIQLVAINRLPKFRAAAKEVDVEGAVWAQKTFSGTFSAGGKFAGQTVDDVAGMLGSGKLSAADVPIK